MELTVGIDLGTTNSVCCTLAKGKFDFLKFRGKELLPSAILWQDGELTVGENARRRSVIYSENFIKSSKTFMGDLEKTWVIEEKEFSPTDVATEILTYIRKEAEKYFKTDGEITAVITVPAYFTANQINETKEAGKEAGFNVKQIITEPVTAAIAYGFEYQTDQNLFVVDIGGGTFDVSILKIEGNTYQTLAIDGDRKLGGDDFDEVILEMCFKKIRQTAGIDLSNSEQSEVSKSDFLQAKQRLIMEAEKKKIELTDVENAEIEIPNLFTHKGRPYNFSLAISRKEFEEEAKHLLNKIKRIIQKCLDDASLSPAEINKIILVGGISYMPVIQEFVKDLFGKNPYSDMDLSKLVAMGAAIIANPESDTIQVRDIISHSLGIEIIGERFEKILIKNDPYPISKSEIFTTTFDYQEVVGINIFEGEDEDVVGNNDFYGSFDLRDIEKSRAEIPQIEVTFVFDKSRDLHVMAKDLRTGSQESKTVRIDKGVKREKPEPPSFDIALLLDISGSMSGGKIETAKGACRELITSMLDLSHNKVSLISFETHSEILSHLSNDENELTHAIDSLHAHGNTNMTNALKDAEIVLEDGSDSQVILLVTDGQDHATSTTPYIADTLKNREIRLITVGIGYDVDSNYLKGLASNYSDYYFVDDIFKLRDIFQAIVNTLQTV